MAQHPIVHMRRAHARVCMSLAVAAMACAGFTGPDDVLRETLVGSAVSVLQGCGSAPEVELDGETERQSYAWVMRAGEPLRERPFGLPNRIPDTLPRAGDRSARQIDARCTLEIEVVEGVIRRAEISGRATLRGDFTTRCAREMLRCLEAR
jgi:hypothetical protein